MDRAGDELFAGPGLARHEHGGGRGGGDPGQALDHAVHGRRLADQAEDGAARCDPVGAAAGTADQLLEHVREREEAGVGVRPERLAARLDVDGNCDLAGHGALWDSACRPTTSYGAARSTHSNCRSDS